MWCRFLDSFSTDKEKRKVLLKVESMIFNSVKSQVEDETGKWEGSRKQNRLADKKVATMIYNSFKSYENGLRYYGEFFKFKRI